MLDEARRIGVTMEDNEEEDFDDHFPGNAGIGTFDDDIPMEEPEVDVAENNPSDDLRQPLHNISCILFEHCYSLNIVTYTFHIYYLVTTKYFMYIS